MHLSRAGVPTALVSIPLRYMHSPVELVQLDDIEAAARLIAAAALRARRRGVVQALSRACREPSLPRARQGVFLMTLPAGPITYHRPPLDSMPWPVAWPAVESDTYVYSGQPA